MPADVTDLKLLLEQLDKKQLIKLVCDFARKDEMITAKLVLALEPDESKEYDRCVERLDASLKKIKYHKFLGSAFKTAARDVAKHAHYYRSTMPLTAFKYYWLIITYWFDIFNDTWDNEGALEDYIYGLIRELEELADTGEFTDDEHESFFATLHEFSKKTTIGCSLTMSVIHAMAHSARTESEKERAKSLVKLRIEQLSSGKKDKIYNSYEIETLGEIQKTLENGTAKE